jgi:protein ImuB
MFACLYLPPRVNSISDRAEGRGQRARGIPHAPYDPHTPHAALVQVARDFSPRVETHGDRTVTLDISGLGSLIGEPRSIGEELRRAAADAGLGVHIAVAASSSAAILLAHARAGLTVVPRGEESSALANLPLELLDRLRQPVAPNAPNAPAPNAPAPNAPAPNAPIAPVAPIAPELKRWGLRTLGDLATLPSGELSARLGQAGLRCQRWARGEELRPLVPAGVEELFEASLDLEWPIDGLEPLSFVLARLLDPLCERLENGDRGAVILRVTLTLVNRERHERVVELPAPMRDARVLRTLALLDLESNPPPAPIDRVAVSVDVTEGRVLQFGLFARALPSDTLATLMARLGALMGSDRAGSPSLVDTYRPGAFAMTTFDPPRTFTANPKSPIPNPKPAAVLRRFRSPIPARVALEQGRPVRVTTDRRGCAGGLVKRSEGPWRSSGNWWLDDGRSWNCDEWEVTLMDGATYRISQAHDAGTWFLNGLVD